MKKFKILKYTGLVMILIPFLIITVPTTYYLINNEDSIIVSYNKKRNVITDTLKVTITDTIMLKVYDTVYIKKVVDSLVPIKKETKTKDTSVNDTLN